MRYFAHAGEDGRLDGWKPEFIDNVDWETGEPILTLNVQQEDIKTGWFETDLGEEHEWDFGDYRVVDGYLILDPPEPEPILELADPLDQRLNDIEAALCEVYELMIGE